LVTLAVRGDFAWLPVVIIGARELFISVYRAMAARRGVTMPARMLGKWKANVQFLAVALALFPPTAGTAWVADTALWIAVAMTVVSGIDLIVNSTRVPSTPPPPTTSPSSPTSAPSSARHPVES
jgi:CDP-diacylglycerol--glycerol-3-phosphate 3-phosphatidyltransferase